MTSIMNNDYRNTNNLNNLNYTNNFHLTKLGLHAGTGKFMWSVNKEQIPQNKLAWLQKNAVNVMNRP